MKSTEVLEFIKKHLKYVPQLLFTKEHIMYNYVLKLEKQGKILIKRDNVEDLYVIKVLENNNVRSKR